MTDATLATPASRRGLVVTASTPPDGRLQFLDELIGAYAEIAGDVFQIDAGTWAIHGTIPVDGSVLVAEYPTEREAIDALARLGPNRPRP